jgi:hypothetical protein
MATKIKAHKLISPTIGSSETPGTYKPSRGVKLVAIKTTKAFNNFGQTLVGVGKVTEEIRDIVKGRTLVLKETARDLELAKDRAKDDAAEREAEGAGRKPGSEERNKGEKDLKKSIKKGKNGPLAWLDNLLGPLKPLVEWLARATLSKIVLEWFADPKNLEKVETFWNTLKDIGSFMMNLATGSIGAIFDGLAGIFGGAEKIKKGELGGAWDLIKGFGSVLLGIAGLKVLGYLLNPFSLISDIMGMADAISAWTDAEAAKDAADAAEDLDDVRRGANAADNVRSRQQILEGVMDRHNLKSIEQAEEYLKLKKAATAAGEEITEEVTERLIKQARKNKPSGILGKAFNFGEDLVGSAFAWAKKTKDDFIKAAGAWASNLKGSIIDRPLEQLKAGYNHAKKKYNLPNNFAELYSRFSDAARKRFDDGMAAAKRMRNGIGNTAKGAWGNITSAVGDATEFAKKGLAGASDFVKNQVTQKIVEPFRKFFDPVLTAVKNAAGTVMKKVLDNPMGKMMQDYLAKRGLSLMNPGPLMEEIGGKAVPIIGGLLNLLFALDRASTGDSVGAVIEFASAGFDISTLFGFVPGSSISLGLDIFSLVRDLIPGMREFEDGIFKQLGLGEIKAKVDAFMSQAPSFMDMLQPLIKMFTGGGDAANADTISAEAMAMVDEYAKGGGLKSDKGNSGAIARFSRRQEKYADMKPMEPVTNPAESIYRAAGWAGFSAGGGVRSRFKNGEVPKSEMKKVTGYPGYGSAGSGLMHKSVADKFQSMLDAAHKDGHGIGINDTYRTYADQVYMKQTKGYLAATPGTSNHGYGLAADVNYTNAGYKWLWANAGKFGFKPLKGWGLSPNTPDKAEAWHWENLDGSGTASPNVKTDPAPAGNDTSNSVNTNTGGNASPPPPPPSPEQQRQMAFDALAKAFGEVKRVMAPPPAPSANAPAASISRVNQAPLNTSVKDLSAKGAIDNAIKNLENSTAKTAPVLLPINKTKVINTGGETIVQHKSRNVSYPTK